MRIRRTIAALAATAVAALALGAAAPASGQAASDVSFTGSIVDSYGAKIEATAGLNFDPIFAYAQNVVLEPAPLATAHGYIGFPGILLASTIITCCGASADYPRFGGRLPSETICGDPGNAKVSEPEVRDPRRHDPPNRPYNTNCEPGSAGCDIRSRGNPASGRDETYGLWQYSEGYGRSDCDAAKLFAQTDQRANNVSILPPPSASGAAAVPPASASAILDLSAVSSPPGTDTAELPEPVTAQQQLYTITMGSVRSTAKSEFLGPGFAGAPPPAGTAEPLAATGSLTRWLTTLGLVLLSIAAATWAASRRIGGVRALTAVGATLLLGGSLLTFAPEAHGSPLSSPGVETRRIVTSVDSRVNDLVIAAGRDELLRIAEVALVAVAEANGEAKGANVFVTPTIRGVKVLGAEQSDVNLDRINQQLAATGLSLRPGELKKSVADDGTSAAVEGTGLIIEQKFVIPGVGGVQTPEYRLSLARVTPSVSFFRFSLAGGEIGGLGGTAGGFTQEFSGGTESFGGLAPETLPDGTYARPLATGIPGVTQIGPRRFVVQGRFAGIDFSGMSVRLWPLGDILEASGGILLVAALLLAARHRRRFI